MALGVRSAYSVKRPIFWGPLFISVVGIGVSCAGLFVTDPGQGYPPGTPMTTTVHGTLHFALGVPGTFGGLCAAGFTFAKYFRGERQPAMSVYSAATGMVVVGGLVGFASLAFNNGPAGVAERISFGAAMVWMTVMAFKSYGLYRHSVAHPELAHSRSA